MANKPKERHLDVYWVDRDNRCLYFPNDAFGTNGKLPIISPDWSLQRAKVLAVSTLRDPDFGDITPGRYRDITFDIDPYCGREPLYDRNIMKGWGLVAYDLLLKSLDVSERRLVGRTVNLFVDRTDIPFDLKGIVPSLKKISLEDFLKKSKQTRAPEFKTVTTF